MFGRFPDIAINLSSIAALCSRVLGEPTERLTFSCRAYVLATLMEESDMLKAKARASLFLAWQWFSPVNCLASRKNLWEASHNCYCDVNQHTGLTQCQSTSKNKLAFNFNAFLTSINLAKAASKSLKIPLSISSCKTVIHNVYMLARFICVSGLDPDPHLIDKLIKELVLFTSRAA